jgi:hypothetical protein
MQMNKMLLGLVSIALLAWPTLANATSESFHYFSASAGGLTADFTVDVVGGLALSGTGTVSSTSFLGTYNLILLTASSTLPAGNGSITPTPGSPSYDLGSGFTWHGVTGSGGADFLGDAVVNASANYFDDYGLIFEVTNQSTNAIVGGLNIWANTNAPTALYATNLSVNGSNVFENSGNGTLDVTPVPEPASWATAFTGLGLMGFIAYRWKRNIVAA